MLEILNSERVHCREATECEIELLLERIEFGPLTPDTSISALKASICLMITSGSLSYEDLVEITSGKDFAVLSSRESAEAQIIDMTKQALTDLKHRLPNLEADYDLFALIQADETLIMDSIINVSETLSSSCGPASTLLLSTAGSTSGMRVDILALGIVNESIEV